ncbi:S-adenosylmethionine:tRNA ribosyltransferase-isomerase [Pedococcus bigeumensis]|uniref:S-adenosylmethionine:tRNA ribosyltransferase-isomerase n=1 Tax=Pedococcus bigeumensis TaxID=433644 RepID=A0A502CVC5_9MICO|nr:S-adenosylmethionine:tRNA ribosyltransferase-isomerase [Pedococcus bigeumensis]TPG17197.1 S-adenosylmethionine:tRNA ribosyltransferase-isomerase [Pedococcus bigeumensis]
MTRLSVAPLTHFASPDDTTAPAPPEERGVARDEVRMMVATDEGVAHARFRDLPAYLAPGDLVVVNNSATLAAEFDAVLRGRGPVLVHAATRLDDGTWVVELRTAPDASRGILDAQAGEELELPASGRITLLAPYPRADSSPTGNGNRLWRAAVRGPRTLGQHLVRYGRPIAYGYLDRSYPLAAYQTVFATRPGSAEMPSAARPFSQELVTRLVATGIGISAVTLHTGVSSQEAGEAPQSEWFEVSATVARLVNATRAEGGRVVAVGTTVTRALESAVDGGDGHGAAQLTARSGWTSRVVSRDDPPRVVTGLVTGWHNPGASHLLLVEAVAGQGLTQRAYDEAARGGYLWHEFGDSALLLPTGPGRTG